MFQPSDDACARVHQVVTDAARPELKAGRSELAVGRLADLLEDPDYDCPTVVLTPVDSDAARIVVEVQEDDHWWVNVADGPGTELHAEMNEDRYALLASMVRCVVAGRYRHGPCTQQARRFFRAPRTSVTWCETFEIDNAPLTSRHVGRAPPASERRFRPY